MGFFDLIRRLLSIRDERGEPTSAHFGLSARRAERGLVTERDCPILDVAEWEGLLFDPRVSQLARSTGSGPVQSRNPAAPERNP